MNRRRTNSARWAAAARSLVVIASAVSAAIVLAGQGPAGDAPAEADPRADVRFEAVHVFVDSGDERLAAYQIELEASAGDVKIVGIEGGGHEAFSNPPYYDPRAMMGERVIIGAFSTGDDLPTGKTRVATVHVRVAGDVAPEYRVSLTVAADSDGEPIEASISTGTGEPR